jgi:hypothetical protein
VKWGPSWVESNFKECAASELFFNK